MYHPIHDSGHCIFRLLCLFSDLNKAEVPWDLIRILDFYILFPHLLSSVRLPSELRTHKPILKSVKQPYEHLPPASRLMFELARIQDETVSSMIAKGLFEKKVFTQGRIKLRNALVSQELIKLIEEANFRQSEWYDILINHISLIPLKGKNGLKDRSGLMEFRYDAI